MKTREDGAEDVTAIELSGGEEVEGGGEKTDPCGAANRVQKEEVWIDAGMKEGVEKAEEQGGAEDESVGIGLGDSGDDGGMEDAVEQSRNGEDKTYQRTGGTDVEESAGGANGRTDQDKSAKGADEGGERYEEGVGGANVMAPAGEEVAEFVGEKDR